jgi:hypothetical protein
MLKKGRLKELKKIKDVQKQSLGEKQDDYMVGMYNGLELAVAIMENRTPVYISCVKEPEQIENKEEWEKGRTRYNGIIRRKGK